MSFFAVLAIVALFANYYIGIRIYNVIEHFTKKKSRAISLCIGLASYVMLVAGFIHVILPLSPGVKSVFRYVSAYWMGFFVYFLLYFALADLVILCSRFFRKNTAKLRFTSRIAATLLTICTVVYGLYNANCIRTQSYTIDLENTNDNLRIVLVSDIHLGAVGSEDRLEDVVAEINKADADVVCIAGDIFDNDYYAIQNPQKAVENLKNIKSKYGVFACPGNHDSGNTTEKMRELLILGNVTLMADSYTKIGDGFSLAGRDDAHPIGGGFFEGKGRLNVDEALYGADSSLPIIVMDHNPSNIDEYQGKADLILCGHTHRGQIFPGSIITDLMYDVDYGYYQKDKESPHVVVSSGVGTWGIPMRVGTDSEVVVIDIK